MKGIIYFILSILGTCLIGVLAFLQINAVTNWVSVEGLETIITYVTAFGAIGLLAIFCFTNFVGSPLKIVFFIILVLVIIIYLIVTLKPEWIAKIFGIEQSVNNFFKSLKVV